jgi:hypothetical protein
MVKGLFAEKHDREVQRLRAQQSDIDGGRILRDVVEVVKQSDPQLSRHIFLVKHVPDQAEDCYTVVVDFEVVLEVEIPRSGGGAVVKRMSMLDFRRLDHSRTMNRTLAAIETLSKERKPSIEAE